MKKFLGFVLIVLLLLPSNVFGQTINLSLTDYNLLLTSLKIAQSSLKTITVEVVSLQTQLQKAKDLQERSEIIIADSEPKINALEISLETALQEQIRLEGIVKSLEKQLNLVLLSLKAMREETIPQMRDSHIQEIKDQAKKYQTQIQIRNLGLGILGTLLVGSLIYIGVDAYQSRGE